MAEIKCKSFNLSLYIQANASTDLSEEDILKLIVEELESFKLVVSGTIAENTL